MAAAAIVHFVVTVAHDGTVKVVAHCFSHLSQIHSTISISDSATFALISDKHNHWDIERQVPWWHSYPLPQYTWSLIMRFGYLGIL